MQLTENNIKFIFSIVLAVLFVGVSIYYYTSIINHYYLYGAQYDTALFSGILEKGTYLLHAPSLARDDVFSFYNTHFSPFLYLPVIVYKFLNINNIIYLGIFMAIAHQFCALSLTFIFYSISKNFISHKIKIYSLTALIYMLFSFNLMQNSHFMLPHIEIWISAFLILAAYFFAVRKFKGLWLVILFALSVREDAGLHVSVLLFSIYLMRSYFNRSLQFSKHEFVLFLLPALISAALILVIDKYSIHKLFSIGFVGYKNLSQISFEIIKFRIHDIYTERLHISVPLTVLLFLSIIPNFRFCFFAVLYAMPWLAFNIIFCTYTCAGMYYYFNFPLIAIYAFPLIAVLVSDKVSFKLGLIATLIALIFTTYPVLNTIKPSYHKTLFYSGLPKVSPDKKAEVDQFFEYLIAQKLPIEHFYGNIEFLSFAPNFFSRPQIQPGYIHRPYADEPYAYGFFINRYSCKAANKIYAEYKPFKTLYILPGTPIFIFTREPGIAILENYPKLVPIDDLEPDFCRLVVKP